MSVNREIKSLNCLFLNNTTFFCIFQLWIFTPFLFWTACLRAFEVVIVWQLDFNYLSNQCLSPLTLWVLILFRPGVLDTTLCDKVCQTGRWFSPGTLVFLINKTDIHYTAEILLKVALKTITLTVILDCFPILLMKMDVVLSNVDNIW